MQCREKRNIKDTVATPDSNLKQSQGTPVAEAATNPTKKALTSKQLYEQKRNELQSSPCLRCKNKHSILFSCLDLSACSKCGSKSHKAVVCNNAKILQTTLKYRFQMCYGCWNERHGRSKCNDFSLKNTCFMGDTSNIVQFWNTILATEEARYDYAVGVIENFEKDKCSEEKSIP